MRIINGSVFVGEGFVERDVFVAEGRFVGEAARAEGGQTVDAAGCYVIPGLVDLHFHGSAGADISDGDLAGLHRMGAYEASRGVTAMCPATMTLPEDVLMRAAQAAAAYEPAADEAALVGINMEGPFISPSKVGAQNPDYVRNPSAEEFRRLQEAAGGLFKLVDIAPEEPGAEEFIREMANEVRISLAHTCTDYDTAARAFELGARQLTHLYNAMDPMHHRKPGPIPAAVEHGEVTAEIIADGVHIHPAMVRLAFQLFGDNRMILISDTLRAAGLEDGTYDLGGQDVTVRGPVATIDNGALAGSVSDLMRCLTVAVRDMGIPLASAVKAASANPARALGLDAERGAIEAGKVADAVLLDKETLDVRAVVLRGELLA
ncbi:N-acetylglucosamine-6-phosphate deacetylase [Gordonibacter urolithinfaciens]|uniref:N-acetylglucosamine-6-phosphate deacetylase n=1 Tax=Gordonibacter urolithinfaciens TaxID=1335613 RepID=A0A423UJZ0_9ACTN|nr:N-acetylglucosamine-6-phosphate deacetylase [Gordonibacter urolithinfaciens]MBS6975759.1 N-acetylglucosamine-6-phosphate deacetylase [Eggerthellaceae bacterium]GKG89926.1 N-acetylglucosamine-6-phosphate deacetylase [Gordonibacter pamelaeae]MCB6561233.1 N-acetylglucosamine-6-phosphate deacetylase [Gordonibacter urolithinfaciens]MCB7084475.1 N-acetylglucosamine-6-phosphate deacetylase [Gordonibacter urolithinfaciens]MSA94515.1 N-acetylglucosamine-6-phosphate deacetylase [Gordonibacter urolith